jgi:3-deoxy-D-manno-octulosonic-acid transferase
VGGAFSEGLHNILEPAVFGKPVIFGKNNGNRKFHEVLDLIDKGGGFEVLDSYELSQILTKLFSDHQFYTISCDASEKYVADNLGSTLKIMNSIKTII